MLGTLTETLLTTCGITQKRYRHLKELAGFDPECDCPQRKDFMNEIPSAIVTGFLQGGFAGAYQNAVQCATAIKERYAHPR